MRALLVKVMTAERSAVIDAIEKELPEEDIETQESNEDEAYRNGFNDCLMELQATLKRMRES